MIGDGNKTVGGLQAVVSNFYGEISLLAQPCLFTNVSIQASSDLSGLQQDGMRFSSSSALLSVSSEVTIFIIARSLSSYQ